MQKKSSFLCTCYILRAIRAGRCGERRCADHIFIQIYFRMYHLVVKFSKKNFSPQAARGHWPPNQNPADVLSCIVLFFCHGRTFSIYLCPLTFWLTLPRRVLSTSWCCPSRPCVVFLACVHLTFFLRYDTRCYFNCSIDRMEPTTKKCKTEKLKSF